MTVEEIIAGLDLTQEQIAKLTRNLAVIEGTRLQGLAEDVARAEEGSLMTRKGFDILAKGIAGKQLKYTRVVVGDSMRNGQLVELTDEEIVELEGLINPREEIPIVDCKFAGNGTMVVQSMLQNANFENGFWCRELGLFAQDPDTGDEVLYSYRNSGILSTYTPSGKGAVLRTILLNLVTVVDNATNITAVLDANLLYVNQSQLIEHVNSTTPHPNIPQLKDELETAPVIWSSDEDNHLHPITINNLTAQILSAESEPISQLNNRVAQVETNVANLFMQLGSPDANLIVFEDFIDCKSVDALKVKVLNTVAGPSDLYVESLDGIIAGHFYTISDGTRSRYLRSKAIASNDGLADVMFDEPINCTFNLNKTYLYRSTAVIEEGCAGGSSTQRESVFLPGILWQGVSSSVVQTLTLNTSQSNAANFELTGNGSFNANGFFTLA